MNDSTDVERFAKDPGGLVELCQDVIDRIDTHADDAAEQNAQLKVIAKAVDQLEKSGVAVPDSLREEKNRLVLSLASQKANTYSPSLPMNLTMYARICENAWVKMTQQRR